MVDPLSISASVVALLQLTAGVIKYLNRLKDAPEDFKRLAIELCTMRGLLSALQDDLGGLDSSLHDLLGGPKGIFAQFKSLLEQITSKVGENPSNKLGKLLHWTLQKEDTQELLSCVERQKSSLSVILQNNQRELSQEVSVAMTDLRRDVKVFKSSLRDAKQSTILRWLSAPDPSTNHNAACAAHSPTTGDWFLATNAFISWWSKPNEFLWVYGLPGCGKSILASTIIEHVNALCRDRSHCNLAYFYFDFRQETKQTIDGFLRCMLVQLSCKAKTFPQQVQKLYDQNESKQQQPTTQSLIDTFFLILTESQPLYLVLDALDECSMKYSAEREALLGLIKKMKDKKLVHVNLLMLSRWEQDIQQELSHVITNKVCIQNEIVDADIRVHVRRLLADDSRLKAKSTAIKEEIEKFLVDGAHGMFRWVVCQVHALRQCRRLRSLREALDNLPESLDETYERVLSSIPKQDRNDAVAALQFLAVSTCAVSVADVAEAVVVDRDSCGFDVEDRLPDPFDIVDVLSSLVTCSSRQIPIGIDDPLSSRYAGAELATEVRLAHYSVKEYINSGRTKGKQSCFYISSYEAQKVVAETCLTYLLQFDQVVFDSRVTIQDYPFSLYAAEYWHQHAKAAYDHPDHGSDGEAKLTQLSVTLLDQKNPSFVNWLRLCDPCGPRQGFNDGRTLENMGSPIYYACYVGLLEVVRVLRDQGANMNSCGPSGNIVGKEPLNGAILGSHEPVISFLLGSGVDVNAVGDWRRTALHQAALKGDESVAHILIRHGAHLDSKSGPVAPYSLVLKPRKPYAECSNLVVAGTPREAVAMALMMHLVKMQMYLESLLFDINPPNEWPWCGHGSVLKTLMYGGADAEMNFATGWTPLHEASWGGHASVVKLFLAHGADVGCKTRYGWNALLFAAWNGHIAVVEQLINREANVDIRSVYGWTPLHAASLRGHESVARLLLDKGADIEAETSYGWTALFSAVADHNEKTLTLLLERGANPDANNSYGGTALHRAARAGVQSSVSLLLSKGASRSIKSIYGMTAIEEAALHEEYGVVNLLQSIPEQPPLCPRGLHPAVSSEIPTPVAQPQHLLESESLMDLCKSDENQPVYDCRNPIAGSKLSVCLQICQECTPGRDPIIRNPTPASNMSLQPISVLFVCQGNLYRSPMAEAVLRSLTNADPRLGQIDSAGILLATVSAKANSSSRSHPNYVAPRNWLAGARPNGARSRCGDHLPSNTIATLQLNGILDFEHVVREVRPEDFANYDYILAMDTTVLQRVRYLRYRARKGAVKNGDHSEKSQLMLFGDFGSSKGLGGSSTEEVGIYTWNSRYPINYLDLVYQQLVRLSKGFIAQALDNRTTEVKEIPATGAYHDNRMLDRLRFEHQKSGRRLSL